MRPGVRPIHPGFNSSSPWRSSAVRGQAREANGHEKHKKPRKGRREGGLEGVTAGCLCVEELATVLRGSGGFGSVRVLTVSRGKRDRRHVPTAFAIRKALDELLAGKTRHDTVLIAL